MAKNETNVQGKVSVYSHIDVKKYDEEFAPYLKSILDKYLLNEGSKYSFVMRTTNGEVIYVINSRAGMPNEADKLKIIVENEGETTRKNLENLTKGEKK